jgi:hypothetical protein
MGALDTWEGVFTSYNGLGLGSYLSGGRVVLVFFSTHIRGLGMCKFMSEAFMTYDD